MSIINEALKKAAKKQKPQEEHRKSSRLSKHLLIIFATLCFFSGLLFMLTKSYDAVNVKKVEIAERVETVEVKKIGQKIIRKPIAKNVNQLSEDLVDSYTKPELILSGIMYAKNKSLAVINDIVMKEGDEVSGLKVIKIRPASVDVEYDEELVALRLKR